MDTLEVPAPGGFALVSHATTFDCFSGYLKHFQQDDDITFSAPAFALKGVEYDQVPINLIRDGGQQVQYRFAGFLSVQNKHTLHWGCTDNINHSQYVQYLNHYKLQFVKGKQGNIRIKDCNALEILWPTNLVLQMMENMFAWYRRQQMSYRCFLYKNNSLQFPYFGL